MEIATPPPAAVAPPAEDVRLAGRDAERLLEVVQELSLLRDLPGVMEVVRRAARELTRADGVTFVLREGDMVHYADEDSIAPLWKGRRFPARICISGWVIEHREAVVIEDIFSDPRIPVDTYRKTFVKSLAVVPIRVADPLGAIGAYWAEPHRATPRELSLLQALAGATATAVATAELYREACEARAAAEALARAKDQFLAVLSHELRTPLTSILGWLRILRTRGGDPATLAQGLEVMERNAAAQAQLVDDLLDTSLIAAGSMRLDRAAVDLSAVVAAAVERTQPAAARKLLTLRASLGPASVHGDVERLQQVVATLLANAVKFTPRGGVVEVSCALAGVDAEIRVRDDGEGISPEDLPHIFDRFWQADETSKRSHRGLGLGLSITRSLVEHHGGVVWAESEGKGRGATFVVRLPAL